MMADTPSTHNLVKAYRQQRGWSQAELAVRAGISRAAVSAIEINRLVPSVAAALSLARAFGCSVEVLFDLTPTNRGEPVWAWPPAQDPCRYWHARVQGQTLRYPAEFTAAGVVAHDGVFRDGSYHSSGGAAPETTLVLACCDPAASLLAAEYARLSPFRLLVLSRSSHKALTLLGQGLVHLAGVHFATEGDPDGNERTVRDALGSRFRLLRTARWQEGLAVAPGTATSSVGAALRAPLRWVGRQPGSAARQCQDELLSNRPAPRRFAHDHRGVADALRCGWADVGVCHRLVSEEAGLRFFSIRNESFDLCFPESEEDDPRVQALVDLVRSLSFRKLLGELPGYDTTRAGTVQGVN